MGAAIVPPPHDGGSVRAKIVDGRKLCRGCGAMLPFADFGRRAGAKCGMAPRCLRCTADAWNKMRLARIEGYRAAKRALRLKNRERINAARRTPEARRRNAELMILWRRRNPARWRAIVQRGSARDPGRRSRYDRANRIRHPEIVRIREAQRKRGKAALVFSPETIDYLRIIRGDPCSYCGVVGKMQVDHVEPLVRGGSGEWSNLAAACGHCNATKSDRTLLRFLLVSA